MDKALLTERVEQLTDYIMKHCLWQFQSRAWDRRNQNEGILGITEKILCEEPVSIETPADRCYWVDAVCLADAYRSRYAWVSGLSNDDKKDVLKALHERIDFLTIDGSLNLELTDQHY